MLANICARQTYHQTHDLKARVRISAKYPRNLWAKDYNRLNSCLWALSGTPKLECRFMGYGCKPCAWMVTKQGLARLDNRTRAEEEFELWTKNNSDKKKQTQQKKTPPLPPTITTTKNIKTAIGLRNREEKGHRRSITRRTNPRRFPNLALKYSQEVSGSAWDCIEVVCLRRCVFWQTKEPCWWFHSVLGWSWDPHLQVLGIRHWGARHFLERVSASASARPIGSL